MDMNELRSSSAAVLTRAEVAELLAVDVRTLAEAIKMGSIPSIQLGRRVMIPREPLLAMLEGR